MPGYKQSDERVKILLQCMQEGMPVKRACEFAQIEKQTFYNWCRDDPDFRLKMDYAKSFAIRNLVKAVAKKDPWKILKNVDSEHFKENVELDIAPQTILRITDGSHKALGDGEERKEDYDV